MYYPEDLIERNEALKKEIRAWYEDLLHEIYGKRIAYKYEDGYWYYDANSCERNRLIEKAWRIRAWMMEHKFGSKMWKQKYEELQKLIEEILKGIEEGKL